MRSLNILALAVMILFALWALAHTQLGANLFVWDGTIKLNNGQ